MKTYHEMTESVLQKAGTEILKKERRRRNGVCIVASGLCLALLLTVLGMGMEQPPAVSPTQPKQPALSVDTTKDTQPTEHAKVKITRLTNLENKVTYEPVAVDVTFPLDARIWVRDTRGLTEEEWDKAWEEETIIVRNNIWNGNAEFFQWKCTGGIITIVSNGHLTLELSECPPISSIDVETTDVGHVDLQRTYDQSTTIEERKTKPWKGILDVDVSWRISSQMISMLDKDPTIPLETIRDTITVTIDYVSGATETLIFEITVSEEGQIFVTQRGIPTTAA